MAIGIKVAASMIKVAASMAVPPASLTEISVGALNIDPAYQRELVQGRIDHIVKAGWNPIQAGAITVVERKDHSLWIIDGQHRWQGAIALKIPNILSVIWHYKDTTPVNEADEFLHINTDRKALSAYDKFRAALKANKQDALEIQEVLTLFGLKPMNGAIGQGARGKGEVGAIRALQDIHKVLGQPGLYDTLDLIMKLWPDEQSALDQGTLQGVAKFFSLYRDLFLEKGISVDDVVAKLGKTTLGALSLKAAANAEIYKGSRGINLARAMLQEYNFHRSAGRLPNLFPEGK